MLTFSRFSPSSNSCKVWTNSAVKRCKSKWKQLGLGQKYEMNAFRRMQNRQSADLAMLHTVCLAEVKTDVNHSVGISIGQSLTSSSSSSSTSSTFLSSTVAPFTPDTSSSLVDSSTSSSTSFRIFDDFPPQHLDSGNLPGSLLACPGQGCHPGVRHIGFGRRHIGFAQPQAENYRLFNEHNGRTAHWTILRKHDQVKAQRGQNTKFWAC